MSIFTSLFKKKTTSPVQPVSAEYKALADFALRLSELLSENRYIAKSEYSKLAEDYAGVIDFFQVLVKSDLLADYCKKNRFAQERVEKALHDYESMAALADVHNESYITNSFVEKKSYLDDILKDVDPDIQLDDDQRRVVLNDEDYCLVVAGAGAGKTTTVAAKVKYLVEQQGIDPKQILIITFTNKAVGELRDKINKDLQLDCPIATFHSTGNAILRKQDPEKLNIVEQSKLYFVVQDYFKHSILKNESMVEKLILFFASYFDEPYEGSDIRELLNKLAKANYSTMKSDFDEYQHQIIDRRSQKKITIHGEYMRSAQEVEIANFLYLNNLDYEYEPLYRYDIQYAKKPYTPDFLIRQGEKTAYIEHFGITEDGRSNRFTQEELQAYRSAIDDKIRQHKQHGTTLLYTYSAYNDGRALTVHLKEELERHGFVLKPRPNEEVLKKLVSDEENRYIRKLVNLICRFITNFKTNGYTVEEFSRMYRSTQNVRTQLFLEICRECYLEYQQYLQTNHAVDFEDMINESARVLHEVQEMKQKLDFKYIIVDEYQDISRQRFDLTKALSEVTDAKIMAVGDDWQSIYAFSGSDISLFTHFAESMGYAKLLKIENTYRNSQEVIDIAGGFIQKNTAQIRKELRSPKHLEDPVIIYTYDNSRKEQNADRRSGANYAMAHAVETALEQIVVYNKAEGKPDGSKILLLGRFGFDGDKLERSGLFEFKNRGGKLRSVNYPQLDITFMTAHASKGLGYDNVIVVNGRNETYGFPSKIEDDPVLAFVIKGDRSIDYAEERRLFYVAMTRTKNRVFFIAPEQNPSEFLLELKRDHKNVVLRGEWNEEDPQPRLGRKSCPICGYPMQYRYKNAFGLRLYICTNEPEICGFMTNEPKAGKLSIMKCDKCRDGYLIVKPGKGNGGYLLGCTNYRRNGTGCFKRISMAEYNMMFGLEDSQEEAETRKPKPKTITYPAQAPKKPVLARDSEPVVEIEKAEIKKEYVYKGLALNDVVQTVLQGLEHVSKTHYYGVHMLADVLRGSKNNRISNAKLNEIAEYGSLCRLSKADLVYIIEWCIEQHFILQTKAQYPVLHPTPEGRNYKVHITPKNLKKLLDGLEKKNDGFLV
ncbi:MAG: UvrD-helicase domain-containing protein [Firmicutes bacterium]|nr:UvrD-helicase domain-containing protein [Bacillota bacterium]